MLLGKATVHGTGAPGSQTTTRSSYEPDAVSVFCVW